ncbi:MAG: amidase family protein [Dehalococcoidia bacterium]
MTIDAFATATEIAAALRRKDVSSREVLDLYLRRIEEHNPRLNAVITLDVERARAEAARADDLAARGEWLGPLHGLPMTVKDSFETAGMRTTCGDPALAEHVPTADALAVARLRAAGAIIFGKTNTPLQTLDHQTYNALFGTTNNPWDLSRVPGGSSGGSATAMAAGLGPLEMGSDIGGSIRVPAHCCGVFGHKPSWGIVPERGHIPGAPGSLHRRDVNVNGPIARSAADLELALDIIAGPDELETVGWRLKLPPPRARDLAGFRIAAWLDDPFCPSEKAMLTLFESAVSQLAAAGAHIDTEARPPFSFEEAFAVYQPLLSGALSPYTRDATAHAAWIAADEARQRMRRQWATFFERYDVLLAPSMFATAFAHAQEGFSGTRTLPVDGVDRPYRELLCWPSLAGAALLPATTMPVGLTSAGLPAGWQVIGPYLEDRTTLAFAAAASEVLGGFRRPPGY